MSITIKKGIQTETLINTVKQVSGVDVSSCLQCKKCSNGCAVKGMATVLPSEIIRKIQLNVGDTIFSDDLVWMCASCETCYARCPMKIDMAAVMDGLRIIANKKKINNQKGNVPLFNKSFLNSVKLFGRTYDLGMIAAYKIGTSSYMKDTDKFPMMLQKGKIALLPTFKADKASVKRVFNKVKDKK